MSCIPWDHHARVRIEDTSTLKDPYTPGKDQHSHQENDQEGSTLIRWTFDV